MTKNTKGIVISLITVAVVTGAWFVYTHNKRAYAKTIVKFGGARDYAWLLTTDEGYVKNWAKQIVKGKDRFTYNGKDYYTSGGKAI